MELEINLLGVLLAFVASMIVGFVWYAKPVFGKEWMKLVGITEKQAQKNAGQATMKMLPAAAVQALLLAVAVSIASYFYPEKTWMEVSVMAGIFLGLVQAMAVISHDAFELRDFKLTLINVGNQVATMLAMGIAIGLLEP